MPHRILLLCTHNSARSQIAEGWVRHLAQTHGLGLEVWSGGTEATRVKAEATAVMASGHRSIRALLQNPVANSRSLEL
jgi:protein-tyrosine-phosphatase